MGRRDTKKAILDSAEFLFSKQSYVKVTFRQIADRAGVHVSQIVYHFRNKELLLKEIVCRRAADLNEERMNILTTYRRVVGEDNMEIVPLIRAFLDPFIKKRLAGDEGWRNYGALIGRIVWDPQVSSTMNEAYDEVAKCYIEALQKAAPKVAEEHIHRAFQFLLAVMFSAGADNKRVDNLSNGKYSSRDLNAIYEIIVPFVAAGFKTLEGLNPDQQESGS